ncbi:MAG: hypothetical protein KF823_01060 [Xanthomonadales bacterium]|nr:hypothetical protein [Xanthomonadales bacterium]
MAGPRTARDLGGNLPDGEADLVPGGVAGTVRPAHFVVDDPVVDDDLELPVLPPRSRVIGIDRIRRLRQQNPIIATSGQSMRRSVRLIFVAVPALAWLAVSLPLQADAPAEGLSGLPRFSLSAGHLGAADNRLRRGTCFELRGEPGPDLAGTGADVTGRWSVQHGFWAGAGATRADTVFFHRFEECRP